MTTDALPWAALVLGTCGAGFRVVSPPELTPLLDDWSQRFAAATGS
jgi:hypothetical protein